MAKQSKPANIGEPVIASEVRKVSELTTACVAVTPGQDRELGVPVMRDIPVDLERKFEQRWAARFARPAHPPHVHRAKKADQRACADGANVERNPAFKENPAQGEDMGGVLAER
jgi:hypothetical protein